RDLAAALFRIREFGPSMILYVVGAEQRLHFQQLFAVLCKLGSDAARFEHVDFGMVTLPEGRMSTRRGRVVFLEDVLQEAITRARAVVAEKNPSLSAEQQEEIARKVGVGAVKYADLSKNRHRKITSNWAQCPPS